VLVNDIKECAGDNTRLPHDDALSFHIHLVQIEFVWQRHSGCRFAEKLSLAGVVQCWFSSRVSERVTLAWCWCTQCGRD